MNALSDPKQLFDIVVQVVVLLFAVSFHESAHGLVALKCGDTTAHDLGRITLNPIKHLDLFGSIILPLILAFAGGPVFGWAKPVPISLRNVRNPRKANLLISAAGPVSNLLLAVVFAIAVHALARVPGPEGIVHPLFQVALLSVWVNVALSVFNLLPIPPLDGFGVLESLLPASMLRTTMWLRQYGFVIFIAIIFLGLHRVVMMPVMGFLLSLLGLR